MSKIKTLIIHDTDLHGFTAGVIAHYLIEGSKPFSHFEPKHPLHLMPETLPKLLLNFKADEVYIIDIPINIRNPNEFIQALINFNKNIGKVHFIDHHKVNVDIKPLIENGIDIKITNSAYECSLEVALRFAKIDSFIEEWALIGALADFDTSIINQIDKDLEEIVCDVVDNAFKTKRNTIIERLGGKVDEKYGNVGSLTKLIVEKCITIDKFIDITRELVIPLPLPRYKLIGDVVYTTEMPKVGLAFKTAWKLCLVTNSKVAIVPSFNPALNKYSIVISTYWREPDNVKRKVEEFIQTKFKNRTIVGHFGAKAIDVINLIEFENIPRIAKELNEFLKS